jgi:DNA-binding beta-propeller fold protein YncE
MFIYIACYAAHLTENINFENGILSFRVKNKGYLINVFNKEFVKKYSFVNDTSEIVLKIDDDKIDGYKIEIINIKENGLKRKYFGKYGMSQGDFSKPSGICSDYFGKIYVADTYNDRIESFDMFGNFKFEFGSFGWASNPNELRVQFNKPGDVTVNRFIYVSDTENHRIAKFDINGNFITAWGGNGSDNGKLSFPRGIAVDFSGNVYVCDTGNDRIQKFSGDGAFIASFGSFGRGIKRFNKPRYIAIDMDYNMYISDYKNNRIQVLDRLGSFVKFFKFGEKYIKSPRGIACDENLVVAVSYRNKTLYISDFNEKYLKKIKLDFYPEDVALYGNKIYISSQRENRIYVYEYEKQIVNL